MTYRFGKALSGGAPMGDAELTAAEVERLEALYERLRQPQRTDDVLNERLAQELDYALRMIDVIADESRRRGLHQLTGQLHEVRTVVGDVGGIVGAQDRCGAVARASVEVKRRLLRGPVAGDDAPCKPKRGWTRTAPDA